MDEAIARADELVALWERELRGDLPEGVKELKVTYEFKLER